MSGFPLAGEDVLSKAACKHDTSLLSRASDSVTKCLLEEGKLALDAAYDEQLQDTRTIAEPEAEEQQPWWQRLLSATTEAVFPERPFEGAVEDPSPQEGGEDLRRSTITAARMSARTSTNKPPSENGDEDPSENGPEDGGKKKSRMVCWIIVIASAVVLLGAIPVGMMAMGGSSSSEQEQKEPPPTDGPGSGIDQQGGKDPGHDDPLPPPSTPGGQPGGGQPGGGGGPPTSGGVQPGGVQPGGGGGPPPTSGGGGGPPPTSGGGGGPPPTSGGGGGPPPISGGGDGPPPTSGGGGGPPPTSGGGQPGGAPASAATCPAPTLPTTWNNVVGVNEGEAGLTWDDGTTDSQDLVGTSCSRQLDFGKTCTASCSATYKKLSFKTNQCKKAGEDPGWKDGAPDCGKPLCYGPRGSGCYWRHCHWYMPPSWVGGCTCPADCVEDDV